MCSITISFRSVSIPLVPFGNFLLHIEFGVLWFETAAHCNKLSTKFVQLREIYKNLEANIKQPRKSSEQVQKFALLDNKTLWVAKKRWKFANEWIYAATKQICGHYVVYRLVLRRSKRNRNSYFNFAFAIAIRLRLTYVSSVLIFVALLLLCCCCGCGHIPVHCKAHVYMQHMLFICYCIENHTALDQSQLRD